MANNTQDKVSIRVEAIKTPLGPVPTLESLKQVINALNILNAEMIQTHEIVNSEVFKQMAGIEKELKSLRKLISEEIVSFEALKKDISTIHKRIDRLEADQTKKINDLSDLITDFIGSVRVFQDKITRLLKKS
ncbi:MAG: hypothetical protein ACTSRS_08355 [Candidatus Helarchaeota archaeon]